jgi:hypothetical protein
LIKAITHLDYQELRQASWGKGSGFLFGAVVEQWSVGIIPEFPNLIKNSDFNEEEATIEGTNEGYSGINPVNFRIPDIKSRSVFQRSLP